MPSTARGNPGEVTDATNPPSTAKTPHIFIPPPFRPRVASTRLPFKPPSRESRLAQRVHRVHPPHSSHAACARFRLARKKSPCPHLDSATSYAFQQLEARAQQLAERIRITTQAIYEMLKTTHIILHSSIQQNLSASSSIIHFSIPDTIHALVRASQPGLATLSTVAPAETRTCALPPPLAPPEDAIT